MTLPVVLTEEAEADFETASDWYEKRAGIGRRFTLRIRESLDRIGRLPEAHAVIRDNVRRAKVKQFPFQIYYRIRVDRIEVIAVLHGHRDPGMWSSRI